MVLFWYVHIIIANKKTSLIVPNNYVHDISITQVNLFSNFQPAPLAMSVWSENGETNKKINAKSHTSNYHVQYIKQNNKKKKYLSVQHIIPSWSEVFIVGTKGN